MPATVPRYCGGAISIKYNGAAVVAIVEKKESRNRPPINAGIVGATDVTMAPTQVPTHPTKMGHRRPCQSDTQQKKAPVI